MACYIFPASLLDEQLTIFFQYGPYALYDTAKLVDLSLNWVAILTSS